MYSNNVAFSVCGRVTSLIFAASAWCWKEIPILCICGNTTHVTCIVYLWQHNTCNMYCVFGGNTYCTNPSEPWLSTSDGQLRYPRVTSHPHPDFPHSGACGNYKRGQGNPQVGCLTTDWAAATINIVTPQVAGNMGSSVFQNVWPSEGWAKICNVKILHF